MPASKVADSLSKRERGFVAKIRTLKSRLAGFEQNDDLTSPDQQRMNQVLLDAIPCVALLLRPQTREIVAINESAGQAGAAIGKCCFRSWIRRDDPCPWCLAPELWATGKAQHTEVEALDMVWDAHWQPIFEDLYLHYAFDITERRRLEQEREKFLHDTRERVKELTCMYGVAQSIHIRKSMEEVFQDVVMLIPPAWHCPEMTRGKIRFEGKEFVSEPFTETGGSRQAILWPMARFAAQWMCIIWSLVLSWTKARL